MKRSSFLKSLALGTTALAIPFKIGYDFNSMYFLRNREENSFAEKIRTGCSHREWTTWLYQDEYKITIERKDFRTMTPAMEKEYRKYIKKMESIWNGNHS